MKEGVKALDEFQRDRLSIQAAQLWGLTDAELAEIQRSLRELTE